MSDSRQPIPPPPPIHPPPSPGPVRGLAWFFVISGAVLLILTLGCIIAITDGKPSGEDLELGLLCGSPTLILGGIFLWLGARRLKR